MHIQCAQNGALAYSANNANNRAKSQRSSFKPVLWQWDRCFYCERASVVLKHLTTVIEGCNQAAIITLYISRRKSSSTVGSDDTGGVAMYIHETVDEAQRRGILIICELIMWKNTHPSISVLPCDTPALNPTVADRVFLGFGSAGGQTNWENIVVKEWVRLNYDCGFLSNYLSFQLHFSYFFLSLK